MRNSALQARGLPIALPSLVAIGLLAGGCGKEHRDPARSGDNAVTVGAETKIVPIQLKDDDAFGATVAIDGTTLIAGARLDDSESFTQPFDPPWNDGADVGAAYVYTVEAGAWDQQAVLTPSYPYTGDNFGNAVALAGDVAAIGSSNANTPENSAGAVHIFRRNGDQWLGEAVLSVTDGRADDQFGFAVAMSEDTVVAGAPGSDIKDDSAGAAYVYTFDGAVWVEQAVLTASNSSRDARFGVSVAMDADVAVIGAPGQGAGGAAYVFVRTGNGWVETATLVASDAEDEDQFGASVAISGDTVIVGAHGSSPPQADSQDGQEQLSKDASGAAYAFVNLGGGWTEQGKLVASDSGFGNMFGSSVSVRGDVAVIGGRATRDNGVSYGASYVFSRGAGMWTEDARVLASDHQRDDQFGVAATLSDDAMLIGANAEDDRGIDAGAVYVIGLNVPNHRPVANAGVDLSAPCVMNGAPASVTLDGSGSSDFDDDALAYTWSEGGAVIATGVSPTIMLGVGVHVITLVVNDGKRDSAPVNVTITVEECPTPGCNASGSVWDACTADCPCGDGAGDCDSDSDCEPGAQCIRNVGPAYGYPDPDVDVCVVGCPIGGSGTWDYCSASCPCEDGEGDCDSDSECEPGLSCIQNIGANYGYASDIDVCVAGCPQFNVGGWDFCTASCPCAAGQGDCDSDSDCQLGLVCVSNVGANYGWDPGVDVCEPAP